MKFPLIENQVRMQYKLLKHEGYYTRVRNSNEKEGQAEHYLYGLDSVLDWARERSGQGNLYISRNPFTKDKQVAGISGFTIDVDKIREPKDRATTEAELRRTLNVAQAINTSLGNCGIISTSGNGILLLYPFGEVVTDGMDQFTARAQQFEKQLQDQFGTSEVRIDATNYAKAILRLMGSVNVKDQDRRKWRYARFLHRPMVSSKRPGLLDAIKGTSVLQSTVEGSFVVDSVRSEGDRQRASISGVALCDETKGLGPAARLDLAEKSLKRLSATRADNYDEWLKVGIALKEFGAAGLQLWDKWSRQSPKYDRQDLVRKFNSFRGDQSLTVGTLKYWADLDSPAQSGAGALLRGVPVLGRSGESERPKLWTPGEPVRSAGSNSSESGTAGISTGFKWLDGKLNGGYRPGVVYAVEACTNGGKSQFIVQTAQRCCEAGRKVLLITTEASIEEVCHRYWSCGTGIPCSQISSGSLSEDRRGELERYQSNFRASHKLGVWYTVSPKTQEIEGLINDFQPEIVLWDYFQHFETGTESRQIQLGTLARWFESTALHYQIPVIVAAQLHERFDFKNRKRLPAIKDDIKDCKVLNDAAKTVIVIDWDHRDQQTETGAVTVRVSLEKNKGPMGETKILLRRDIPRFEEI